MAKYDAIVLGTGPAASSVIPRLCNAGWKVAVVDPRPGGTCAMRGCDPKKLLLAPGELREFARRMKAKGIARGEVDIDFAQAVRQKNERIAKIPPKTREKYEKLGADFFEDTAEFTGPDRLKFGGAEHSAKHIVIAVGAKPRELKFPGAGLMTTSDDFLELKSMPKEILFVGGGYISFEFAFLANQLGSKVSILQKGDGFLRDFDSVLCEQLSKHAQHIGITIRTRAKVNEVVLKDGRLCVHTEEKDCEFSGDIVVHGAGREPSFDGLSLSAGEVDFSGHGIVVDEFSRSTSNPHVFAVGDCAASGGKKLTPSASREGRTLGENLISGEWKKPDLSANPTVVYTLPRLARVGMLEKEAREQGLEFDVHEASNVDRWLSSLRVGAECAGYRSFIEKKTGRILGAHILSNAADDQINIFSLAMRHGLTATDIKNTLFAYPSWTSEITSML